MREERDGGLSLQCVPGGLWVVLVFVLVSELEDLKELIKTMRAGAPAEATSQSAGPEGNPQGATAGAQDESKVHRAVSAAEGMTQNGEFQPRNRFRWTGRDYEVIIGGGKPFFLGNTLAARYLDYFLHRPNQVMTAFSAEVAVIAEKGQARASNSIQPEGDERMRREYRQELDRLKKLHRAARDEGGQRVEVKRLGEEIRTYEAALKGIGRTTDTGERARNNLRKPIERLRAQLAKGGPEQRALAEHIRTHLSLGHECYYRQPEGQVWE